MFKFRGQVLQAAGEQKPAVTGLTFIHTSTQKDAKKLLTTDFNADPNVCAIISVADPSFKSTRTFSMWAIISRVHPLNGTGLGVLHRTPRQVLLMVIARFVVYVTLFLPVNRSSLNTPNEMIVFQCSLHFPSG